MSFSIEWGKGHLLPRDGREGMVGAECLVVLEAIAGLAALMDQTEDSAEPVQKR
jgi:hypothetical protein